MNRFLSSRLLHRIICLLLLAAVLSTAMSWLLTMAGNRAYQKNDFSGSASYWRLATFVSWYDKDIPYADYGNALYRQNKFESAAKQYEKAVPHAPKHRVCDIRINWSLSLMRLAEQVGVKDKRQAISRYSDALRAISAEDCTNNPQAKEQSKMINQQIKDLSKREDTPKPPQDQGQTSKSVEEQLNDNSQEQKQRNSFNNRRAGDENRNRSSVEDLNFAY